MGKFISKMLIVNVSNAHQEVMKIKYLNISNRIFATLVNYTIWSNPKLKNVGSDMSY